MAMSLRFGIIAVVDRSMLKGEVALRYNELGLRGYDQRRRRHERGEHNLLWQVMCGISVLKCLVAVESRNFAESKCVVPLHQTPIKRGGPMMLVGRAALSMAND